MSDQGTARTPRHIVLIPDGNRRWARARLLPSAAGHRAGAEIIGKILKKALELDVPYLTFWAASASNILKRSPSEVAALCRIFTHYFEQLAKSEDVHAHKTRIEVIGRWRELLPPETRAAVETARAATASYDARTLTILLAYSGVEEMAAGVADIASAARRDPDLVIDAGMIGGHLWSRGLPPVDLVIRTGGEPHLSEGMLMWLTTNAQLYFTETLWPDFSPEELARAIAQYGRTERRRGA